MSKLRLAFVGFRHGHVMGLWKAANAHPDVQVVAACEEDAATAAALPGKGVTVTHRDYRQVLRDVPCDAVAVGDYFGRRGEIVAAALEAGKHVIADKPVCTSLAELDRIEQLVATGNRAVGCLLDLRDHGVYRAMRRLIREGAIGEVITVVLTAQHPLLPATRPGWYFENGKHGGTINDIGVHAIDLIPWMTGRRISEAVAARAWNARVDDFPHFQDAAQFMLRLDNGGGVLADVSYLAPDGTGYTPPQYWRVTCHGTGGFVEGNYNERVVRIAAGDDKAPREIPADADVPGGCLDAFLLEVSGRRDDDRLTTDQVLDASRRALRIQDAADRQLPNVLLGP